MQWLQYCSTCGRTVGRLLLSSPWSMEAETAASTDRSGNWTQGLVMCGRADDDADAVVDDDDDDDDIDDDANHDDD